MAHPISLVSRIKGALLAGLGPKLISRRTGIPASTIKKISRGQTHAAVPPDEQVGSLISDLLLGRRSGP